MIEKLSSSQNNKTKSNSRHLVGKRKEKINGDIHAILDKKIQKQINSSESKSELHPEEIEVVSKVWNKLVLLEPREDLLLEWSNSQIRKQLYSAMKEDSKKVLVELELLHENDFSHKETIEEQKKFVDSLFKSIEKRGEELMGWRDEVSRKHTRKWSSWPKCTLMNKLWNCAGITSLTTTALESIGIESYVATTHEHVLNIARFSDGTWIFLDMNNGLKYEFEPEEITIGGVRTLKINHPKINYRLLPIFSSEYIWESIMLGNFLWMTRGMNNLPIEEKKKREEFLGSITPQDLKVFSKVYNAFRTVKNTPEMKLECRRIHLERKTKNMINIFRENQKHILELDKNILSELLDAFIQDEKTKFLEVFNRIFSHTWNRNEKRILHGFRRAFFELEELKNLSPEFHSRHIQKMRKMIEKFQDTLFVHNTIMEKIEGINKKFPYSKTPEVEKRRKIFAQEMERLVRNITHFDEDLFRVDLMRAVAKLEDGHTNVKTYKMNESMLPLNFRFLWKKLYIVAAAKYSQYDFSQLISKEIVSIWGRSIEELYKKFSSLQWADNDFWPKNNIPDLLRIGWLYHGLNILSDIQEAPIEFLDWAEKKTVHIPFLKQQEDFLWWIRSWLNTEELRWKQKNPFSVEILSQQNTCIFLYDKCIRHSTNTTNPAEVQIHTDFKQEMNTLFKDIKKHKLSKMVIDLRYNSGGDSSSFSRDFIPKLVRSNFFKEGGKIVLLIANGTFSSGTLAIEDLIFTDLKRSGIDIHKILWCSQNANRWTLIRQIRNRGYKTYQEFFDAIGYTNRWLTIMWLPSGGPPSHFWDVIKAELPYSKYTLIASTKHFLGVGNSYYPDIEIEPTPEEYFSWIDVVMQKAVEY